MTIECQEHRTAAEADGLVIATANRADGPRASRRRLAWVFHPSPEDHRPDHRGTARRRKRRL